VLLTELDLHDVTLVGFAMGTGEVTRYLAVYGSRRVRGAALLAPLPPFLLRTGDNPDGIDRGVFEEFMADICDDRPAAVKTFLDRFYNIDFLGGSHVSDQAWQNSFHVAIGASARATLGCTAAWLEDFRGDLPQIDVPVLVMQGSQDRVLPREATGDRLPALIRDVHRVVIEGGPHAIIWTHAGQINQALLDFIPLTGTP
jgi:non-heme chloroperoxidase